MYRLKRKSTLMRALVATLLLALSACGSSEDSTDVQPQIAKEKTNTPVSQEVSDFLSLGKHSEKVRYFINPNLNELAKTVVQSRSDRDNCRWSVEDSNLKWLYTHKKIGSKQKMKFYYEVYQLPEHQNSSKENIVLYLNGGPGANLMGPRATRSVEALLNAGYKVIKFDQRGFGCNMNDFESNDVAIDLEHMAYDLLRVIHIEEPSSYLVYANSFGTFYGSALLDKLSNEYKFLTQPKFAIFTGTLGKSMSLERYVGNRVRVLNSILTANPYIKYVLKSTEKLDFLGYSQEEVETLLKLLIAELHGSGLSSVQEGSIKIIVGWFKQLEAYIREGKAVSNSLLGQLHLMHKNVIQKNPSERQKLSINLKNLNHEKLKCNTENNYLEFDIDSILSFDEDFNLVQEEFDPATSTQCPNSEAKTRAPYDSRKFQTTIPIVYIHGTHDASSPFESAKYHYDNQINKENNLFVTVQNGGHGPLSDTLRECSRKVFSTLFSTKKTPKDALTFIDSEGKCKEDWYIY